MIKVLFVCVHNSARSQMAEAFMNKLGKGLFLAESAGLRPGKLNPDVIDSMAEIGYDIKNNATKSVFDFYKEGRRYQYVIKVCDQISGQKCPIFPATKQQIDWNHEDPSQFEGTKTERLEQVRLIREDIRKNVKEFIEYHQIREFDYYHESKLALVTTSMDDFRDEINVDDIIVNNGSKVMYGACQDLFKQNERKQFGNSVVAATNLILLKYAHSIKKTYDLTTFSPTQVLGLMDEMWDIIYPIKQGKITMEAFVNGIDHFANLKKIDIHSTFEPSMQAALPVPKRQSLGLYSNL